MSIQIRMTDYAWNGTALLSPGDTPSLDGSVAADLVNGGKAMYISERESNKEMSDVKANVDPVTGGIEFSGKLMGNLANGEWFNPPSVFRLLLNGTGTVTIDSKDAAGTVTTGVFLSLIHI